MHRPQILSHRTALGGGVMKAAVVPAVSSSWQIKDVPQPQPGPNQVLVKMHASGICYTDVHQRLGHFPGPFPRILGHEPVGEIVAVAADVTTRKIGDRGGTAWFQTPGGRCEWCQRGRRLFCPYLKGTADDGQHSGTAARRPTGHASRRRRAAFGFADESHLEAHSNNWQPAKRPRIPLRST